MPGSSLHRGSYIRVSLETQKIHIFEFCKILYEKSHIRNIIILLLFVVVIVIVVVVIVVDNYNVTMLSFPFFTVIEKINRLTLCLDAELSLTITRETYPAMTVRNRHLTLYSTLLSSVSLASLH